MSSSLMSPPQWNEKNKEFSLWLREVEAWKCATVNVSGLKDVHGLQLVLQLPEGSEIRRQVFDTLEVDQMKGEDGWKSVIDLLKTHYMKDDSSAAFDTWKKFRTLNRKDGQTIDEYIMYYEQYKGRMKRYKMELGENIHGLNLLCGANLSDDELRIAMREVDTDTPVEMYTQAKKSLRKYFGNAGITSAAASSSSGVTLIPKTESTLHVSSDEYETFLAWRQNRKFGTHNQYSNYDGPTNNSKNSKQFSKFSGKTNPVGRNGQVMACRVCKSIAHFEQECPHKHGNEGANGQNKGDSSYRTWIATSVHEEDIIDCNVLDVSSGDALNYMILDTGCPQNVAGKDWVDCFLDCLSDAEFHSIKKFPSSNKFKFGGGTVLSSLYKIEVPLMVAGTSVRICFDVIENELPLLLGKQTMKEWNLIIHTQDDTAEVELGDIIKKVELYTSKSGHWCMNIRPSFPLEAITTLFSVIDFSTSEKQSAASRLHRQFCHPPYEFLKKVLSIFDTVDDEFLEILEQLSMNCKICKRYKRTCPKPAVGNLVDPEKLVFNELVSIDLKERNGHWIMYMIDVVTRFTRAEFISTKEKHVIVDTIIKIWLSIFGAAKLFLMDNGGEFANEEVRELGNQFGIFIKHTAAYAPWANGLNERNHATIDVMMEKMLEDSPELSEEVALQYAISIRNCCMYVHGFTPAQLAIGQNPKLPSAFHDKLPALEGKTTSPVIAQHLNAIASARKAFAHAQTSAKLRKALKHPVRSYADIFYNQGDVVFYKPPKQHRWEGPATVIGRDGKVVLIKHGSVLRRVHPCRLQMVDYEKSVEPDQLKLNESIDSSVKQDETIAPIKFKEIVTEDVTNLEEVPTPVANDSGNSVTVDGVEDSARISSDNGTVDRITQVPNIAAKLPKKNEVVRYKYPDGEWQEVTVLGRAGSARGKNKNWLNVQDKASKAWSLDWSDVEEWGYPEESMIDDVDVVPEEESEVLINLVNNDSDFDNAKQAELQKWKLFEVYDEVADHGQQHLTGRWVYSEKQTDDGVMKKARFVVRGFQEKASIQSDSPTGSKECMRLALFIIASKQWTMRGLDVKAAFLQGNKMEREVYLKPPSEARVEGKLWKLNKCVYGLNDAARMWYFAICEKLKSLGCTRSSVDFGIFILHKNDLSGILQIHVDDFLWAGDDFFETNVIYPICTAFSIGKVSTTAFTHLGLKIIQNSENIQLDQIDYINSIVAIDLNRDRQSAKNQLCNETESFSYRQLVGRLNWVAGQSRPDIAFDTCLLSASTKHPKIEDVLAANKVLRRIKEKPLKLTFPKLENLSDIKIICYSDASLANLPSGRSTGGYILFVSTSDDKCCPIMWRSNSIKRVVRSTLAAETSALIDALDACYFLAVMISEMLYGSLLDSNRIKIPIIAYVDNESLYKSAYSTTMVQEHRLRIDLAIIKEMLEKKELLKLLWIPNIEQLADCLTKRGANSLLLLRTLENGYFQ